MFVTYDYLITFDEEVKLFWNRKWNGATVLFLVNRYLVLLLRLCNLLSFIHMTDEVGFELHLPEQCTDTK